MFAYSFHTGCDKNGFVLGVIDEPSNIHDSQVFLPLYQKIKEKVGRHGLSPWMLAIRHPILAKFYLMTMFDRLCLIHVRIPKKAFFASIDHVYDEYYNCYICPANEVLTYRTTTREGYHQYVSNPKVCKEFALSSKCTQSKSHMKQIHRHIWQDYLDEVEHLRHTDQNKQIYEKRKETIERVFADMKEKHGMRWTTLRTKRRVDAGDACLCCHEFEKTRQRQLARRRTPNMFFIRFCTFYRKNDLCRFFQRSFCLQSASSQFDRLAALFLCPLPRRISLLWKKTIFSFIVLNPIPFTVNGINCLMM